MNTTTERNRFLAEILELGIEAGVGGWAELIALTKEQEWYQEATIREWESGDTWCVTLATVEDGLARAHALDGPRWDALRAASTTNAPDYNDADAVDTVIQLGLWGHVRHQ